MRRALLVPLLALATGCSPILGLIVQAARGSGSDLRIGDRVSGSTEGAQDAWQPPCGATSGGGDRAYVFVPERSGTYRVEVDAEYDSVVAIFDDTPAAIVCNDDTGATSHSVVETRLEAGRRYTVVVDGYHGATGGFSLLLEATALDEAPVDGEPPPPSGERVLVADQRAEGDTSDAPDTHTPPCGSTPGSPDDVWTFTPAESGSYQLHVDSTYDGVIAIYARGSSTPIACNDDFGSTRTSRIIAQLEAGTAYDVVVDGYHGASGGYSIGVTSLGATQATGQLAVGQPVRGDTRRGRDTRTPGCGTTAGGLDETWTFTPPRTGAYQLDVDSSYDAVLALYEQGASDPIQCNDDFGSTQASRITEQLVAGRTYEVVVDGWAGRTGPYMLRVTEIAGGGGGPIALDQQVQGHTAGGADTRTPSCGASPRSPDQTWLFTPPADGMYQIHVDADYDSVVALYSGSSEMGCNDDFGGTRASRIETSLRAGQTYEILVDGYRGRTGTYRLRVSTLAPPPPPPPPIATAQIEHITAVERRCGGAPALTAGTVSGTVSAAEAHARTSCGRGGGGGEAIYTVSVQQPSTLRVQAVSPLRPVLELRAGCSRGHTVVACDGAANDPERATVHARLVPGTTYTLIVDTQAVGDGAFTLEVAITPDAAGPPDAAPPGAAPSATVPSVQGPL